jgi:hypothetical protein
MVAELPQGSRSALERWLKETSCGISLQYKEGME